MMHLAAIVAGFILDLIFGDPHWLPHPICLIGNMIGFIERHLRPLLAPNKTALLVGGALMVVIVTVTSFVVPLAILLAAAMVSPWLAFALEAIMYYQIFATKCLRDESMKVYDALHKNDLADARVKLSWIVGRDTKNLDEEEITKGAVETVAENTADGIIAPMLYMFLGGAPLAFLYKSINTMDSMVGYKNEKYLYFGRAAAKLDDVVNYIPSRISACLMVGAAYLKGKEFSGKNAWRIYRRDSRNHASPNSAQTESVCAGALGIRLAGDASYFGKIVKKPYIGDALRPVETEDIRRANMLMYLTAWICEFLCLLLMALAYLAV